MRDLGAMGESTFSLWCADAGLVANNPKIDQTGWDFLVEFPLLKTISPELISTTHKASIEAKVQVKATDKNNRKLAIKLSNLKRLVTSHLPAFFVFLEFDGKSEVQNAFLVHVDKELMGKVLKRLYKLENEGKTEFHKHTMTIHYNNDNEISSLNGEALKSLIQNYVGESIETYIKEKLNNLQVLGYEDGCGSLKFSLDGIESLNDFIDMTIGLKDSAQISELKMTETRFGISKPMSFLNEVPFHSVQIMDIEPDKGKLQFKKDKLSPWISFDANLYYSSSVTKTIDKLSKIRYVTKFFEMVVKPFSEEGIGDFFVTFDDTKKYEIHKIYSFFSFMVLLKQSSSLIGRFHSDNIPNLNFKIGNVKYNADYQPLLELFDDALLLKNELNLTDNILVSVKQIYAVSECISQMAKLFRIKDYAFKIQFNEVFSKTELSKKSAYINILDLPLGEYSVFAIIVITGFLQEDSKKRKTFLKSKNYKIERKFCLKKEDFDKTAIIELLNEIEDKYESEYQLLVGYDKDE